MALPSTPYDPLFQQAGEKHGVDPAILKAIASVESDFRPDAVGPQTRSGQAKGMMQFVPATAKAYGLEDPFNPEQSVDAAARLMKDLLRQFDGNVGNALEAYNGGPRLVGKSKQTAAYRQKVLQRAKLTDSTQLAAKTPPASQQMPPVKDRVALSSVEDLPAGYKAAIALQYFTDLDPEGNPIDNAEQTLAELRETRELDSIAEAAPSGGGALLQKFFAAKNKGSVSPFDIMAGMQQEEQPTDQGPAQVAEVQGFADGGFAFRGTSLPAMPNPYLNMQAVTYTPEEQAFINAQKAIVPDIGAYNSQLDAYKTQVDAYNKRVQDLTPEVEKYNRQLADYERQVDAYNAQVELWNKHFVNATPGHEYFYYYLNRNSLNPDAIFASKNPEPVFTAQAPNFGPEPVAPTAPLPKGYTQAQYDQYVNQINAKQGTASPNRKLAEQQELALDVVSDPNKYNLSGFGFSAGGAADKQGMLEKVKRFIVENDLTPADFMLTPRTIPLGMMLQPTEANAGEAEMLERYRRMAEQEQGKVVGRAKGSGPRAEEVPQIDASGRVVLPEPTPENEYSLLERIYGFGEAGLSALTGIAAAPVGAARGLLGGDNIKDADRLAGETMQALTFTPRTEAGKESLQDLAGMIPQELTGAMPQSQLMNIRVNPGAAKYLGDRAVEATERGVMPIVRSQTENPDLQPADVYGAMLTNPAENVAGAAATYAVRPGGSEVDQGGERAVRSMMSPIKKALQDDTEVAPETMDFINGPLVEKAVDYVNRQYGTPSDPLYKAFMEGRFTISPALSQTYNYASLDARTKALASLNQKKASLQALDQTPEVKNEIASINNTLTAMYDEMTPMEMEIPDQAIQVLLDSDDTRTDIAFRLAEEVGNRVDNMSYQEMLDKINGQLKKEARSPGSFDSEFWNFSDLNKAISQHVLDNAQAKIMVQGGKLSRESGPRDTTVGGFSDSEAAKYGQPTYYPQTYSAVPYSHDDLILYLKDTPVEKYKDKSFPDLVITSQNSDVYKKITDPEEIAKRIDNGQTTTKEQKFTGSTPINISLKSDIPGAHWREITDVGGVLVAGRLMKHCLSQDPKYASFLESGQSKYFNLYDKQGQGYVTIQMDRRGMDGPYTVVKQIKGRYNANMSKELENELTSFLDQYEQQQPVPLTITEGKEFIPEAYQDRITSFGMDAPDEN